MSFPVSRRPSRNGTTYGVVAWAIRDLNLWPLACEGRGGVFTRVRCSPGVSEKRGLSLGFYSEPTCFRLSPLMMSEVSFSGWMAPFMAPFQ